MECSKIWFALAFIKSEALKLYIFNTPKVNRKIFFILKYDKCGSDTWGSTLDAVQNHHSNYYICNRNVFSWTNVWDHLALWLQTETNEIPLFSTSLMMSVISLSVPGYLSQRETESNKESDTGTQEEHRSPGTQVSRIKGRKTDKGRKWKVQLDPQGQNQQNKPGNN